MNRNDRWVAGADGKALLQELDRQELIREVVTPYFKGHGWNVKDLGQEEDDTHGCNLLLESTVLGERVLEGVHIEAGKSISTEREVRREILVFVDPALNLRYGNGEDRLYKYFWITTGQISPKGRGYLRQILEPHPNVGRVEAWDIDTLHDKLLSTDILDRLGRGEQTGDRRMKVFLSYASEDRVEVERISRKLRSDGFDAWRDQDDLLTGENWKVVIRRAMLGSDAVITFLSKRSVNKLGPFREETELALSLLGEQPEDAIFLLPVQLDDVPLDPSHRLNHLHRTQLLGRDDLEGYNRLLRSLKERERSLREADRL